MEIRFGIILIAQCKYNKILQSLMIKYSVVYIIPKYIQIVQEKGYIKSQDICMQSNNLYTN